MESSAATEAPTQEHTRALCPSEGFDISKIKCAKIVLALDEAAKNDSVYIPSKLLDYITGITLDVDAHTVMMGCTLSERCDWIVSMLEERIQTGQYWVCLKVFSIIHELLCRGSNEFVASLYSHGMNMLEYNNVISRIRSTTQTNLSGAALPCTLQGGDKLCMSKKSPAKAEPVKRCRSLFSCSQAKPQPTVSPAAPVHGEDSCVNGCAPRVISCTSAKDALPNTGTVDLYQPQQEFLWTFLGYLEALCQYRFRHPHVDVARGRLQPAGDTALDSMAELKTFLDDTLELLKSIATSDPHVPKTCLLVMTMVRKRMNDARLLYSISCLALLKMLEHSFMQASLCMSTWRERLTAEGHPKWQQQQQQGEASNASFPKKDGSTGGNFNHRFSIERLVSGDVTEQSLRNVIVNTFAQWYNALFQFDRTVQMLTGFCEEVEAHSGETYLVATHLHRIPASALEVIRALLKKVRNKQESLSCEALSECDLTSSLATSGGANASSPTNGSISSADRADSHSCGSFTKESGEAHLEDVRRTWSLQIAAMRQIFEMEGDAPPALAMLQAELDDFINANKELMTYQQSRQQSAVTQGLSSSGLRSSMASAATSNGSVFRIESTKMSGERYINPHDVVVKPPVVCGGSGDEDSDSQTSKTLSRVLTEEGSIGDPRGTGTFILRRRSPKPSHSPSNGESGADARGRRGTGRTGHTDDDLEVIPLTDEMQRTDESIQELLRADDVVVVCNETFSSNDTVKLTDRFQIISGVAPIGEGTYGRVYRAWDELIGCYLAAKEMPLGEAKQRSSAVREVLKEYMMLTELNHRNIVRVVAFMVVGKMGRIFMEWMPSGSLQDVLRFSPRGALGENVVSRYAYDALQGLNYLHSRGVLHRDVKPGNMLLGADGTVKLTDFGTSSVLSSGKHTLESAAITGTAPYMAPEAVQGLYSATSDVWSFGCSILELVTGKTPWADPVTGARMDAVPLLFRIGSLSDKDSATLKERPNSFLVAESDAETEGEEAGAFIVSDELADFLKRVFVVDRKARPTAQQLLQHPFIQKHHKLWEQRQAAMTQ